MGRSCPLLQRGMLGSSTRIWGSSAAWRTQRHHDFTALGAVAQSVRPIPKASLSAATMPVLVLNGGTDEGAADEWDLTPFVPAARRVKAGDGDHLIAPSDPLFQGELASFLLAST